MVYQNRANQDPPRKAGLQTPPLCSLTAMSPAPPEVRGREQRVPEDM